MSRAAALALLLASPARAADPGACRAGWRAEYAEEWEVSRTAWDELCAKGYDASDALRQSQLSSANRCTARFGPYEGKGKVAPGEAAALCAQGAAGRERLAAAAGLPPKRPPPPPAPPPKPGMSKMGPLGAALGAARARWRPDSCFSGLYYLYTDSAFVTEDEWERARAAGRAPNVVKTQLEEYSYYFHSDKESTNMFRVSFGDDLDAAFCYKVKRMDGPDAVDVAYDPIYGSCIDSAEVDVSSAVAAAAAKGFRPDIPLRAYLAVFPTGYFGRVCRGVSRDSAPVRCDLFEDWDQGALRRAAGKPAWLLSSNGMTAIVDANNGRVRFVGRGNWDQKSPKSFKYAEKCSLDPEHR